MYPWFRVIKAMVVKQPPLESIWDTSDLNMRVWPSDIDIMGETNNGRFLTLMDFGRYDLYFRLPWVREAVRRNNWGAVVAGSSVRYRKRLFAFQKFTLYTRLLAADDRWLYLGHSIERRDTIHVSGLFRIAVTDASGIVPVTKVAEEAGVEIKQFVPEWIKSWDESDQIRPWVTMPEILEQPPKP